MGLRTFKDAEGKVWRVWHVVPQSDVLRASSPGMAAGWLCFENDGDKRRLAEPPETWKDATDEELCAMLGQAAPVMKLNPR